jgi:hypothetical protein
MRFLLSITSITLLVCMVAGSTPLNGEKIIAPLIELQSGPLTPGLRLAESPRPIHQVRLVVDADLKNGKLILDGNHPEFDLFGDLISGLDQSPYVRVRGKGEAKLVVEIACSIKEVDERPDGWRLYRINGRDLRTSLRVATHGSIADGGQARLVILGADDKVTGVVECVRFGLAVP